MASKTSTLKVNILGDASSLRKAFGSAEKSASSFGQKVKGGLTSIAVGGAAVAGVGMFAKSFYDAGIESQNGAVRVLVAEIGAITRSLTGIASSREPTSAE